MAAQTAGKHLEHMKATLTHILVFKFHESAVASAAVPFAISLRVSASRVHTLVIIHGISNYSVCARVC